LCDAPEWIVDTNKQTTTNRIANVYRIHLFFFFAIKNMPTFNHPADAYRFIITNAELIDRMNTDVLIMFNDCILYTLTGGTNQNGLLFDNRTDNDYKKQIYNKVKNNTKTIHDLIKSDPRTHIDVNALKSTEFNVPTSPKSSNFRTSKELSATDFNVPANPKSSDFSELIFNSPEGGSHNAYTW
jgi:hypothetical protein